MAQINWVFLDDFGGRHRVGLYHGDRSGHLMIHCNMRVVQVDFSVRESKTYSFFIEDEFIEIIVERMKNGGFGYEFRVNKEIDTPRNRVRRVQNRQDLNKLWVFIGGFVLVLAGVFFGLRWYGEQQDMKRMATTAIIHNMSHANVRKLAAEGRKAVAALHTEILNGQPIGVYTFKTADSIEIRGVFPAREAGSMLMHNGFPLTTGDAFSVFYLPDDPQVHRIDLFQPDRSTVEQYLKLAMQEEGRLHPEFDQKMCVCRVLALAEAHGWPVLADIIFQHKTMDENPRHNEDSYRRLMGDPGNENILRRRCGGE